MNCKTDPRKHEREVSSIEDKVRVSNGHLFNQPSGGRTVRMGLTTVIKYNV